MKKEAIYAVIGCGLGGATMAALLQQYGYNAVVFEQAKAFSPVGAGIHVCPNAMKVLRHLGLESRLLQYSFAPSAFTSRSWDTGEILFNLPLNSQSVSTYDGPYVTVHRGDFHQILVSAVKPETIHYGKRLRYLEQSESGVHLYFEDGYDTVVDFVIGADGLSSVVRALLTGQEPPVFSGQIAFRSIIPAQELRSLPVDDLTKWWAPDRFVISYYLDKKRALYYFVAGLPGVSWDTSDSSIDGSREELLAAFEGFHPAVQDILAASTNQRIWPLFERPPLSLWQDKRIVLLGDACHPMRPHMAQGAAMAIEDAAILLRCLQMPENKDPEMAFIRYSQTRMERTAKVQQQSGENTWLRKPMDPAWVFAYDAINAPIDNI